MNAREILAHNLKAIRAARTMSQEDLADRAEVDRTYVSSLERCQYSASVDVLQKLAAALEVELDALLKNPEDESSSD